MRTGSYLRREPNWREANKTAEKKLLSFGLLPNIGQYNGDLLSISRIALRIWVYWQFFKAWMWGLNKDRSGWDVISLMSVVDQGKAFRLSAWEDKWK